MRTAAAWALLLCLTGMAGAHSWYPIECCSGQDCQPVSVDDLVEQSDGSWKYLPTGLVFPKETIRPSQDRHFHVCIGRHSFNFGKPLCAFVLQGS